MTQHIDLKNDLPEICRLKNFIETFGGKHCLSKKMVCALLLALEEIVSNIIRHGGGETQKHRISISIGMENNTVAMEVQDDTRPFNLLEAPAPDLDIPLAERNIGGLGIHLVRSVMDEVDYVYKKGKNVISMKKHI